MKRLFTLLFTLFFFSSGFSQKTLSRITPPQFPGGKAAMETFIDDNMQYPEKAAADGIKKSVRLQVKVDTTGKIFEVLTGQNDTYGFTDEAVRIVELMPQWEPAMKNGNPIATKYSFYIDFNQNKKKVGPPKQIEKIPSFPGGNRALRDFIIADLKYPEAVDSTIAGAVVLQVQIDETGKISNRKVVKTLGQPFTESAYEVLDKMPLWEPGIADGVATPMWYSIPFAFTTNEDEKEASKLKVTFKDKNKSVKKKKGKKKKNDKKEEDDPIEEEESDAVTVRKVNVAVKKDSIIYLEREPLRIRDTTYKQSTNYVAPQYPGGDEAFQNYYDGTMVYPKKARKKGLQGVVKVKFRVSPEGAIVGPKIVQSQGAPLDTEALRLVKYMPKWIPAYVDGEPILDDVVYPITFVLPKK